MTTTEEEPVLPVISDDTVEDVDEMNTDELMYKNSNATPEKQKEVTIATDEDTVFDDAADTRIVSDEVTDNATSTRHTSLFDKLCSNTSSSVAPQANRQDTVAIMDMLLKEGRAAQSNVFGRGPMLVSDIPKNAFKEGVIMGIDEAGRGPVLGPMTYGAAFWAESDEAAIPSGYMDSKALTAQVRSRLFEKTLATNEIGFVLRVLHASEISRNMLRSPEPYNLNQMSHDAAIDMIRSVLDAGVKIQTCYVDTVGTASYYQSMLERVFGGHGIKFVVEKKADAKYAACSAASVVAKVARDRMIEAWKFTEQGFEPEGGLDFGSGYPGDPKCKTWMEQNFSDSTFCFPDLVRFSWGPTKKTLESTGIPCEWEGDEEEEEKKSEDDKLKRQQLQMQAFVGGTSNAGGQDKASKKRKRAAYFEKKGLCAVATLHHG